MQMIPEGETLFNDPPPPQVEPEQEPQPANPDDQDDNLVVVAKGGSRINTAQIKKLYDQVNKQDSTPRPLVKQQQFLNRKRPSVTEKKKPEVNSYTRITEDGMNNISNLMDIYKFSNTNRFITDVAEKIRSEFKERVVSYLLHGIEQLKDPSARTNQLQKSLLQRSDAQLVDYVKNIANEVDMQIVRHHNKAQKNRIERGYKDRANIVLVNIKDQLNSELRLKVLNRNMTPEMLATVREMDLYTTQKRQEILSKSRSIMAQNTLEIRTDFQEKEAIVETIKEQMEVQQPTSPVKSRYVDQKLAGQVIELINKHVQGFYSKLRTDLPKEENELLCSHLEMVFPDK